jgi:hypothetical protein
VEDHRGMEIKRFRETFRQMAEQHGGLPPMLPWRGEGRRERHPNFECGPITIQSASTNLTR